MIDHNSRSVSILFFGASGIADYADGANRERTADARVPPPEELAATSARGGKETGDRPGHPSRAAPLPESARPRRGPPRAGARPLAACRRDLRCRRRRRDPRRRGPPSWSLIGEPDPLALLLNARGGRELKRPPRADATRSVRSRRPRLRAGHPRYLGDLPTDGSSSPARSTARARARLGSAKPTLPACRRLRPTTRPVYHPLGVGAARSSARSPPGSPLERDGLSQLATLFLDRALRGTRIETLVAEADYLRWQRPSPRPLTGLHALLDLEEVTIVAVPDAVHRRWAPAPDEVVPPAPQSTEPEPAPGARASSIARCVSSSRRRPRAAAARPGREARPLVDTAGEPPGSATCSGKRHPRGWEHAETISWGEPVDPPVGNLGSRFYRVRAESGRMSAPGRTRIAVGAPERGRSPRSSRRATTRPARSWPCTARCCGCAQRAAT